MKPSGKEIVSEEEVGDIAARQLSRLLANVVGRHGLAGEVYVMMTSPLGLESDIFTRPYDIQSPSATALSDVWNLRPEISIAQHIALVAADHPGTAFILDQETAIGLSKDPTRPVTLIDCGDDHCLLIGLHERGIDVFLTCPMTVIQATPGMTVIAFKS